MPGGARAVRDDRRVHNDEAMARGAFGKRRFQPVKAVMVVSVEAAKESFPVFDGIKGLLQFAAAFETSGLFVQEWIKHVLVGFSRAVAGDVVIALGEEEGRA